MKHGCLISLVVSGLAMLTSGAYANEKDSALLRMANTVNRFNRVFPQEKVYLHFDNTGYYVGETIWFKAYMQTSDSEGLKSRSRVLYVELIDPSGNVIESKKLKIENGMAHGDIRLDQLPLSGFYEVRAYTRYMLNWGRDAVFSRVFPVFKRPDTDGDYGKQVLEQDVANEWLPDMTVASDTEKKRKCNVKFYPEGGSLIDGLKSKVAFECYDSDGKPLSGKGWLMDGETRLTEVSTLREGRGVFTVTPAKERTFSLSLTFDNGKKSTFSLPACEKEGAVMTMDALGGDSIRWTVALTEGLKDRRLAQMFVHNGRMYCCNIVGFGPTQVGAMARADMPSGVTQVVLADTAGNVFSNRLVFVAPRKGEIGQVAVAAGDSTVWPGKRMTLEVSAKPRSNISLSVCDARTQTGGWAHNAATWWLLTSDLRGYINHPEYYVESDDEEHRRASDLLMMVQGWRRYNVKMMAGKEMFVKRYPIEDRLYIDGQLKQRKKKNTVDNVELGLVLTNERDDQIAGQTVTDAKGNYAFAVPDCYRQWNMLMMTRKDDKDVDYYITVNRHFSPSVSEKSWLQLMPVDSVKPSFAYSVSPAYEEILPMDIKAHWLKDVYVYGRKRWTSPRQFWERENRGAAHSIVRYDCQREADKIADSGGAVPTLEEWLKSVNPDFAGADILAGTSNYDGYNDIDTENYNDDGTSDMGGGDDDGGSANPFKERSFHSEGLTYRNRPIMWIVNNSFFGGTGFNSLRGLPDDVRDEMRMALHVNFPTLLDEAKSVYVSVKSDDWMRFVYLPQLMGRQYVTVYVYTYMNLNMEKKGLRVTTYQGYDVPDEYEQVMGNEMPVTVQNDYRRTLYWNPNVKLDAQGKAKVRFLTNSTCRYISVSAEGFTDDGIPVCFYQP